VGGGRGQHVMVRVGGHGVCVLKFEWSGEGMLERAYARWAFQSRVGGFGVGLPGVRVFVVVVLREGGWGGGRECTGWSLTHQNMTNKQAARQYHKKP